MATNREHLDSIIGFASELTKVSERDLQAIREELKEADNILDNAYDVLEGDLGLISRPQVATTPASEPSLSGRALGLMEGLDNPQHAAGANLAMRKIMMADVLARLENNQMLRRIAVAMERSS